MNSENNDAFITQSGDTNTASVTQEDTSETMGSITQTGNLNQGSIFQHDDTQSATGIISTTGNENVAAIEQRFNNGANAASLVNQNGDNNNANILQDNGDAANSTINQNGSGDMRTFITIGLIMQMPQLLKQVDL